MFESKEDQKDDGKRKLKRRARDEDDMDWLGLGCNKGSSWNLPPTGTKRTDQTRKKLKVENDDSKVLRKDQSWIWEGGGKKSQDVEDSKIQFKDKDLGKKERDTICDYNVPTNNEPGPMGDTVLQRNFQKLRKRKRKSRVWMDHWGVIGHRISGMTLKDQ